MRKNRIALHQLRQDHDGDNQAVQGDGLTQSDEDQALTEGLFVLAVGSDSSRRSGGGGPLLITVPSTGGGAAGKDRLTRYIREAIGVKI